MSHKTLIRYGDYVQTSEPIPDGVRWHTPSQDAGQFVEHSYGSFGRGAGGWGDPYLRTVDRTVGQTTYYRYVPDPDQPFPLGWRTGLVDHPEGA